MNVQARYGYALSTHVAQAGSVRRVQKRDMRVGDRLHVYTDNSLYDVYVIADGWYEVSGGWFDTMGVAPLRTTIVGCTWGGSVLMADAVAACGLCIEFGNRVVTSPIRKLIVIRHGSEN